MDVEKSLDERISDRKGSRPAANRAPRPSRPASNATPYARPPPRSTDGAWTHDMYNQRGGRPAGGAGFRPRAAEGRETRLLISNLHYEVTKDDLTTIFSRAGTIVDGPIIRYDRSGRSTGVATVNYENNKQAKDAINRFDGNLAKGQALNIRFDDYQPRATEQMSKGGSDLLGRIEGGSKMRSDSGNNDRRSTGPARNGNAGSDSWGRGATRAPRPSGPAPSRGGRSERGPRSARGDKPAPKSRKPLMAEDLDKELDTYHAPATTATTTATAAPADGDVEMA
ncbi:RNA-binding domain-containing protein [Filobasidium floriforme]|uniref:RNA-binding domain-containing protein n=1 Tax=Filobasidium floriforme TaxID=5210 RepID=UPI001E8ED18A|nr:RNA-binding domain-containing protein [Filobasidium floriforme]XP_046034386.1 RNA-binding domain-containing protein [Filobasidium floriforme]KAH8077066.1 RNA-binding domain-containing protein [Filobasidium floriforme]KAH8080926.1 RNA-binding domain-containing protein [Filobasidium floriforme]